MNFGLQRYVRTIALAAILMSLTHCRLTTDNSQSGNIYPPDGSTEVPVNAIIEVQYPKEFGLTDADMKHDLFAIHECQVQTFDYFNKDKTQTTNPTTTPSTTNTTNSNTSGTTSNTSSTGTNSQTNSTTPNQDTTTNKTIGANINFYVQSVLDPASKIVFNYLLVNPGDQDTPLKPATTYCVDAKKIKNQKGVEIGASSVTFTTEDSDSFGFDTKVNGTFFGKDLVPSVTDKTTGRTRKDYLLLYLSGTPVKPELLKNKIRICKATANQATYDTATCNGFNGQPVTTDVYLLESLVNSHDQMSTSHYNLYAVTPHDPMVVGDQYKAIFDTNLDENADTNSGVIEQNFDVIDSNQMSWVSAFQDQIKDEAEKSVYSKFSQFFYIGSKTYSNYKSDNSVKASAPEDNLDEKSTPESGS